MILRKKVVIVLGSLELGGAERQALLLARYLTREQDAHIQVWGFSGPGRASQICEEYGIPWRITENPMRLKGRIRKLLGWAKFVAKIRLEQPDILLPYTIKPNVVCGLSWRWTGAKLCIWNQRDEGLGSKDQAVERRAIKQISWIVSNSQHGADFLVENLGVKASQIRVIHNGVELVEPKLSRASWRSQMMVGDQCFLVCMLANLTEFKDHATLLKAWRKVVDRLDKDNLQAVLVLAGRLGNTTESIRSLAFDLGLVHNLRFLGKVDDVTGLLGAIDLGVLSSLTEGCPNGVLEYMAAGLAVTGTDIPGIREAVGPEGYEFLAAPGDVDGLADQIVRLLMNPELRETLGSANRLRVEKEFNPKQMCTEMLKVINTGLGE